MTPALRAWVGLAVLLGLVGCSLIEVRTETSEQRQAQASATVATVAASVRKRDVVRRLATDAKTGEQVERIMETERTDTHEDRQEARQEAIQATIATTEVMRSPAVESGLSWIATAAAGATGLGGIVAALLKGRAASVAMAAVRHVANYADDLEKAESDAEVQVAKSRARQHAQDAGVHRVIQKARGKL